MGFKKNQIFTLNFDGTKYEGMEITCTEPNITEALKLETALNEGGIADLGEVQEILARHINTWNMEEDDGTPSKINLESVQSLGGKMLLAIVAQFIVATLGVDENLTNGLNSGETSQEEATLGLADASQDL